MNIDKDKLKALAEAAVSGAWSVENGDLYWHEDGFTKHLMETEEGFDICNDAQHPANLSFIAAANPATILALLAEIERLTEEVALDDKIIAERDRLLDAVPQCAAHGQCVPYAIQWVRDAQAELAELREVNGNLKIENEALRKALGKISVQVDGNIRCTVRDVVNGLPDVQDIYDYCDNIDEIIAAAMGKESGQ